MKLKNTPLRTLVKTFSGGIIGREEYISIRSQLLQKLEETGKISESDLDRLLNDGQDTRETPVSDRQYTSMDWILIILGLAAAIALAVILYN